MKRLYLVRHGYTETNQTVADYSRVLSNYGIEKTYNNFNILKNKNYIIDYVLSSTSIRTKQTFDILNKIYNLPEELVCFRKSLYYIELHEFIEMISCLNNKYNNILTIGHNPTLSNVANYLTGENEIFLQPSNIVIIDLSINKWEEISFNTGKKIELI